MKTALYAFMLVVFCWTSTNVSAAVDPKKWSAVLGDEDIALDNREDRLAIARGLREQLKRLDAFIPSLKPEQESWLEGELRAADTLQGEAKTSKLASIISSPESGIRAMKNGLQLVLGYLDLLLHPMPPRSTVEEGYYWAQISYELGDSLRFGTAVHVLERTTTIRLSAETRQEFFLMDSGDRWGVWRLEARRIFGRIVLPLLERASE